MERNLNLEECIGKTFRHFKGGLYEFVCIAKHTETMEDMVIYRSLNKGNEGSVFARPKDMFLEKVDKVKYPEVKQEYRLELI